MNPVQTETTPQNPTPRETELDRFLKLHYDPLGNAFQETFGQWLRRNTAGLIVPTILFLAGAITIVACIIAQ